jgi:hypothetical protein
MFYLSHLGIFSVSTDFVLYWKLSVNVFDCLMVFNATFKNISVISWRLILLVEETGVENH